MSTLRKNVGELLRSLELVYWFITNKKLSRGCTDRASATETVDFGSIPGRVKPKTIKIVKDPA